MDVGFAIEAPWGLGATYAVHPRLIGKLVGDFLLVILELFLLGAFVLSQCTRLKDRQTDGQTDVDSKTVRILLSQSHSKNTAKHKIGKMLDKRVLSSFYDASLQYTGLGSVS